MKYLFTFLIGVLSMSYTGFSQVAIGTTEIESDAIFQLESDDKGLLIPKVALLSRDDVVTVTPSSVEGLLVYNTIQSGIGNLRVNEGFYYWDGTLWVRLYTEGYTEQFMQSNALRAQNQTDTYTLPNLDNDFVAPYTGTYQIHVIGHYAAAGPANSSFEAVGYSEIMLEIDNSKVASSFVTSSTKQTPGNFLALAQQTTIIHQVDLVQGQTYNFKVRAKELYQLNMSTSSLGGLYGGGYGIWGTRTDIYDGNIGDDGINGNADDFRDGQRAVLTITLLRQF